MAISTNSSMQAPVAAPVAAPASSLTVRAPYPGYWHETYRKNYAERLYRMSQYVGILNAPSNQQHPSNPLTKLSLAPMEAR